MSDNLKTWPEKAFIQHGLLDGIPKYGDIKFPFPACGFVKEFTNDIEYIRKDISDERVSRAETARTKYIHERIDYIGKQYKEIDELQNKVKELESQVAHWKSNHDNQVAKAALLLQREDLPVDRIPAYKEMERLQERVKQLESENIRLANCLQTANSNHELFERKWYLEQYKVEKLEEEREELKSDIENSLKAIAQYDEENKKLKSEYIAKTWYPFQGVENQHNLPIDLVERIRCACSRMGIATHDSLEGFSFNLESIMYRLCSAIDAHFNAINQQSIQSKLEKSKIISETVEKCAQICENTLLCGFDYVEIQHNIANNIRALLPTNGSKE